MIEARGWIGAVVLLASAAWLGDAILRGRVRDARLADRFAAGLLLLHLWLQLLSALSVPWTLPGILAPTIGAAVAMRRRRGRAPAPAPPQLQPWVWSDWVLATAVAAFAWSALTLRSVAPDFVYHWGVKGRRFLESGGVDWAFLTGRDLSYLHPDYPLLLPDLQGAAAVLGGRWEEAPQMLLSVVLLALLLVETRGALDQLVRRPALRRMGSAAASLALAAIAIGHYQAGGADIPFALAVVVLSVELAAPTGPSSWRIGLWAAFALAVKIEGAPLALLAVVLALVAIRRTRGQARPLDRSALASMLGPPALVGGWWALDVLSRGLLQPSNAGWPTPERVLLTLQAVPRALSLGTTSGFPWLLALLPVLGALRWTRPLVALSCGQVAFYLWVYFGGEQGTTFWVLSSLPRLAFHVLPVVLVGILVVLDQAEETVASPAGSGESSGARPASSS